MRLYMQEKDILKKAYGSIRKMFGKDESSYTIDSATKVKIYGWTVYGANFSTIDIRSMSVDDCVDMYIKSSFTS